MLIERVWVGGNVGRARATFAPLCPFFNVFQLEKTCIHQRVLERQESLAVAAANVASAQPVPTALPPVVLVGFIWVEGNVGRPDTSLGPFRSFFLAFQLECACIQQCLLERQELLFLATGNVACAQPVPIALPPVVRVDLIWAGGDVGRPGTSLAQLPPLCSALKFEGACIQQRLVELQKLLWIADTIVTGAKPVPIALPTLVLVECIWAGVHVDRPDNSLGPVSPFLNAF